jgi:hypothetical protein
MVGGQGQLLAAVPAAAEPMASGARTLGRDLLPGQVISGFEKAEGEVLLVASLYLAQGDLLSLGVPASEVLGQIGRYLGADLLLRDLDGALQFASTPALRENAAALRSGETIDVDGRLFRLDSTPTLNSAGALVGEILVLADATAEIKSRRLLLLVATALLVVADDLLNLLERAPDITGSLAEIASMGDGLGVHLLAGTQEAGSKRGTGGPAVESNVTARVVYKSSSAHAAARATGQGGAGVDLLTSARGDALLIVDGEPVRVATGWADDREILQLGQGCATVAPWRSATTHNRLQPTQPPQPAPITPIESAT